MNLGITDRLAPVLEAVRTFIRERVEPVEAEAHVGALEGGAPPTQQLYRIPIHPLPGEGEPTPRFGVLGGQFGVDCTAFRKECTGFCSARIGRFS